MPIFRMIIILPRIHPLRRKTCLLQFSIKDSRALLDILSSVNSATNVDISSRGGESLRPETVYLIETWAPLVYIHSQDPFYPSSPEFHLQNVEVCSVTTRNVRKGQGSRLIKLLEFDWGI